MEWTLFADLAEHAGDRQVPVDVEPGDTVGAALEALLADRPALADRVRGADGDLRTDVKLLHNGTELQSNGESLETTLEAGDDLALLPPVSGG